MTVIDDTTPKNNDDKVEPTTPVDLTQVHESTMHKLDEERADDTGSGDTGADDPQDPADNKTGDDDTKPTDPVPNPDTPSGDDPDEKPQDPAPTPDVPVEQPKPEVKPEPQVVPDEPLNTDITKHVEGKVAVKDSEGNTFYFNNIDEVPDDFEPASYKEAARMGQEFALKADRDAKAAEAARIEKQTKENQAEIDAVTASWDKDIDTLTKGGVLPADEKEREVRIGDTYAYISKKLADGVVVDSFAEAHKAMMWDRQQEAEAQRKAEAAKLKKEQGGKVMSGSPASSGKPKVFQAPPAGVSLDAVHAHHSGLLNNN